MKPSKYIFCLLILTTIYYSCKQKTYHYPQDRRVAYENGILKDSLSYYFALSDFIDSSQYEFLRDTFWQDYISTNLFALKEPVLYNDYLGKELYRFLWLPSFNLPLVITIGNDNGETYLNTKRLDRRPMFMDYIYSEDPDMDSAFSARGFTINKDSFIQERGGKGLYTIIKGDRRADIIHNETRSLTNKEWKEFKLLFNKLKFWNLKSFDWAGDADGAAWILEAHTRKKYKYIIRQHPGKNLNAIGNYLLGLSGVKEELY